MAHGTAEGRRRALRWPLVVLLTAVLCSACAALGWPWVSRSSDDPPSSVATLVTWEQTGGLVGERITLTVTADGSATLDSDRTRGWTRQIPTDEVQRLRSALEDAGFEGLADTYPNPGTCNDCFRETVTYRGRSVAVENGDAPPSLEEPLRMLGDLAISG